MGKIVRIVGVVVLALLLIGVLLYATDYGVEATVTDKGHDTEYYFIASTKLGGFPVKHPLPVDQWNAVNKGNFIVYHIASGHYELYQREGGPMLYRG